MPRWWALAVSIAFLASAVAAPRLLKPLNILWFKFGLLLHHIVNPILMALIYFGAVVPTGLMLRMIRKDLLRLEWEYRGEELLDRARTTRPACRYDDQTILKGEQYVLHRGAFGNSC